MLGSGQILKKVFTLAGCRPWAGGAVVNESDVEGELASPPTSDIWKNHQEPLAALSLPIGGELPRGYGEDYIVLLARDPAWLFAYWEITAESWASSCGELQDTECQTVLRVFHLPNHSQVPTSSFDITVQPFTEEWHIHTGKTGGKFRADIGIRTPTGSFRQIASSNIVQTPRGRATTIDESGVPKVEDYSFPFPPAQPGTSPMDW